MFPDDKFVDDAIERFERAAPGQNRYLVRRRGGEERKLTVVQSEFAEPVWGSEIGPELQNPEVRAVVLHTFAPSFHPVAEEIPPHVRIAWFGWGYDYYPTLLRERFPDPDGLLGPRSRELHRELYGEPEQDTEPLNHAAMGRVGLFIPILRSEWQLACELNPWFRPAYLPWGYGMGRHDAPLPAPAGPSRAVLVGNSAALSNNHLDAFDALLTAGATANYDRVVVPLSYGPPEVAERIIEEGRARFGERFTALTEMLPREEYEALLASCHTVVLGHIRQQALGNVAIAVRAGARIVMHPDSVLRAELSRARVRTDPLDRFTPGPLAPRHVARNRRRFRAYRRDRREPEATQRVVNALLGDPWPPPSQ